MAARDKIAESWLDKGLDPDLVKTLTEVLPLGQLFLVNNLIKDAWRKAGLFAIQNCIEITSQHTVSKKLTEELEQYKKQWQDANEN